MGSCHFYRNKVLWDRIELEIAQTQSRRGRFVLRLDTKGDARDSSKDLWLTQRVREIGVPLTRGTQRH